MNLSPKPRSSVMHDQRVLECFKFMWLSGVTAEEMAEELGLSGERQVRFWRKRLGLPSRGMDWCRGRPRPSRRI